MRFILPCLCTLFYAATVCAAPDVAEIVQKANFASYYNGDDGSSLVEMVITDSQDRTRTRLFTILRKDESDGGNQSYYVYFKRPSDIRKTTFLVHKHIQSEDDRWLYLPGLDLLKRLAASDKRTSFMGSHFFYEDVSGRNISEDLHTLEEETAEYYILNNIPKKPDEVEFSAYTIWIDKTTYLPMKAEYLDKSGKGYRTMEVLNTAEIQGFTTVTKSKISDLNSGGSTITTFSEIKYNIGLDQSLFTERYLRRPPREARQ
ncbi:MAG: outer membrane lipoprotein-sorting protein [Desulfobulbaceae bacterium]|jgi:outer membrane lipoprotein-sorting protein|nr:outer membrane lipoprotein-sorting protein [Desulfobulbaceae bacterium]